MATIIGTPGNDFLVGTKDADLILGLAGNDTQLGLEAGDTLSGNEGQDIISGGLGNDLINGNQGNDVVNGNEDNDTVYGGADNDQVNGGKGNDLLYGDLGNDSVFGDLDNDTVFGGAGFDFLNGNAGNDVIYGNEDNDSIFGGDGNDLLSGGQNNDLLVGDTGLDTVFGDLGNDTLYGGEDDDYINGNQGDDFLSGNDGFDTVYGGQGNDSIFGGKDNDLLSGDKGKDTIFGNLGRDSIFGGEDDDFINGNQDRDTIYGGQGNDSIFGGEDDDLLYGDKGNDTVFGNFGNDSLSGGVGADFLYGNEGDDTLNGNEDNDTVYGGQGNDIVRGGKGNDLLFGDKGSDTIYGDIGADTLTGNSGDPGTQDIFVIGLTGDATAKTTGGLTIADADVITDWDQCIDKISLTGGLSFDDIVLQQGTGANAGNTIVSISNTFKGDGAGEFLVVFKNVGLSSIDGTSFVNSNGTLGPARPIIVATDPIAVEPITTPNGILQNNGEFTIFLPCKAETDLPITYTVTTGSGAATPGVDFEALSGVVIVPKGSNQVTIPVIPVADTGTEAPETVTVTLDAKGAGFVSGTPQSATVTIFDAVVTNQPIVFVTAPQPTTKEGSSTPGTFQFARTGGDITKALTISYTVAGTATPADYTPPLSGTITIPANQTVSSLITITASTDSTIEPTETVIVSTKQDSNYVVGSQSTATVSILEATPLAAPPAGQGPIVRYNSGGTLQAGSYTTFTAAVAASNDNDIIVAQPGEYNEPGTVAINKPLTVRGSNAGLSPGSGSLGPQAIVNGVIGQPVFAINTNAPVTIEGLTIQGKATDQNLIQGNVSNSGLVIRQNQFTGTGPNNGGVIRLDFLNSTGSATIVDNLIRDIQPLGSVTSAIQAFRINNVTITDNVIANLTGPGIAMDSITGQAVVINNSVSNVGQNGIQLAGGNATISNNNITNANRGPDGNPNTGDEDPNDGGIRLRNSGFNPATSTLGTVNVTSNLITNSINGFVIRPLQVGDPAAAAVTVPNTVKVNQNNFIGNTKAGLLNGATGGILDATNNWWGVATGPVVGGTGQNAITGTGAGSVTFIPFASTPF